MNTAQAGLYVDQLTVTWRNGHTALRDASFSVPRGAIAALVGVNGSGKSTLFKALMGFVRVGHGEIAILGQPVNRALRQNLVAYVPQSEEVDWSFPVLVEDVVMMGRYGHMGWLRRAKPRDREIVDAALARVGAVRDDARPRVSVQVGGYVSAYWMDDSYYGGLSNPRIALGMGVGRGGKAREETLEIRSLNNAAAARARKGKQAQWGFKPQRIECVE